MDDIPPWMNKYDIAIKSHALIYTEQSDYFLPASKFNFIDFSRNHYDLTNLLKKSTYFIRNRKGRINYDIYSGINSH